MADECFIKRGAVFHCTIVECPMWMWSKSDKWVDQVLAEGKENQDEVTKVSNAGRASVPMKVKWDSTGLVQTFRCERRHISRAL